MMTKYQKYQLQWMIDHGYSLQKLMIALENHRDDSEDWLLTPIPKLFKEWNSEIGFNGEIWASESEFNQNEASLEDENED